MAKALERVDKELEEIEKLTKRNPDHAKYPEGNMTNRDAAEPYFAMWVDNAELLVAWKKRGG